MECPLCLSCEDFMQIFEMNNAFISSSILDSNATQLNYAPPPHNSK